jgi:hypothetical protein
MVLGAEVYCVAAQEHVAAARELYNSGRYVLAHYVAGLAVECMLRAYRCRMDKTFYERHCLQELARAGRFFGVVPAGQSQRISTALSVVVSQWQNGHRYRSEASFRRFLVDLKLYLGIRGDIVKENTRRVVDAAFEIITLGVMRWKNSLQE